MNEPRIDTALVQTLIKEQFPQWADLPVSPVKTSGWDNRTYHLGPDMSVRLPSAARYAAQVQKEQTWLPKLSAHLPLAIPHPLALGHPGAGYPFHWSVMSWRPGEGLGAQPVKAQQAIATDLALFLNALRKAPRALGPAPGAHNFYRGGDLRIYDQEVRHCLQQLGQKVDSDKILSVWTRACHSSWPHAPVWVHGDVAAGNLLVTKGKLSSVIDFGSCGIGDPACDLTIAWTVFEGSARTTFKDAINLDTHTWTRAAGWGLWKALLDACNGAPEGFDTLDAILGQ